MRREWTDESREREIRAVADVVGHFPSNTELQQMGRHDLSNQICRNGGFVAWSERIGVARADSDSDFGWEGERKASELFIGQGYQVAKGEGVKAPFDLLVNDILRVDVKTARYAEYGACRGWFYRIGKTPQADLIFLLQFDTGEFYPLPWFACPRSNATIARDGGKYAKYRNNWDVVRQMLAARQLERATYLEQSAESA
jgi:hypothetical protein